jgi:hypothetical protein
MENEITGILETPAAAPARVPGAATADVPEASEASLECSHWLTEDVLLLVIQAPALRDLPLCVHFVCGEQKTPVEASSFTCRRKDSQAGPVTILLVQFPEPVSGADASARIRVQAGFTTVACALSEVARREVTLENLTANVFAKMEAAGQPALLEALASCLAKRRGTTQDLWLSNRLFTVREALRPSLPRSGAGKDRPHGLCVDEFFALDETAYYVRGWAHDALSRVTRLSAVAPEGHRAELLERAFRHNRADLDKVYGLLRGDQSQTEDGFISFFETAFPSHLSAGWRMETRNARGQGLEAEVREVVHDPEAVYNAIFAHLAFPWSNAGFMSNHLYPAVTRLSQRCRQRLAIDEVVQFGTAARAVDVSIIIRLQTPASLEHQLLEFARDPELSQCDLIYILDGPKIQKDFPESAFHLFQLYRVPFRTVTPGRTVSFVGVEEMGVSLARGRLLLFLDERVSPLRPGWLGELVSFYDSTPTPGAVAPRLVYENGCVHHAGLCFSRSPRSESWEPRARYRGLHRDLPEVQRCCRVPAVGKSCLLVGADLYKDVSRAQGVRLENSYEDADLCLRLQEAGRANWYVPGTELFYASRPDTAPAPGLPGRDTFDRWVFNHRWQERLEAIVRDGSG